MKTFFTHALVVFALIFSPAHAFAKIAWKAPSEVSQGRGFIISFKNDAPFKGEVIWRKKKVPFSSSLQEANTNTAAKNDTPDDSQDDSPGDTQDDTQNVSTKNTYTAQVLLGMPTDAKGNHNLSVIMEENIDGKVQSSKASSVIKSLPVKWVSHNLTVEPKFVQPPQDLMARIKAEREQRAPIMANISPKPEWELPFKRPVNGTISGSFAARRVFNNTPKSPHMGTDMRGAIGTSIRSMAAGKVVLADHHYYSGNAVFVDHGQGVISMYGHMSSITVKNGDIVKKGQELGKVGATGRVTGPHYT